MGVVAHGAPVFTIGGDPGGISTRAAVMMARAEEFRIIHSGLSALSADGWEGRAADHFRSKFKVQVQGWVDAQEAFSSASEAYSSYASRLASAQSQCDGIRVRWEQGRDAVQQAQNNQADARSQAAADGGLPVFDASCDEGPGRSAMAAAVADFETLVDQVNEAGDLLITALNAGIAKLPERTWWDALTRTASSIMGGAFEAVVDIVKLLWKLGGGEGMWDFGRVLMGDMTLEEYDIKHREIPNEMLVAMGKALWNDPVRFMTAVGKSLSDWDTWTDDPGRAIGHLLPDVVLAIATMGGSVGVSAGEKALTGTARALRIGKEVFKAILPISPDDIRSLANLGKNLVAKLSARGLDTTSDLAHLVNTAQHAAKAADHAHDLGHAANGMAGALDGASDAGRAARTGGAIGDTSYAAHAADGAADAAGSASHASHGGVDVKDSALVSTDPGHRSNGVSSAAQPAATPHASAAGDASTGRHAAPANTAPSTPNGAHNNAFMNADTGGTTHGAGNAADGATGVPDTPATPPKKRSFEEILGGGDKQPHGGKHAADTPATHADEAADARKAGHGSSDAHGTGKADADAKQGHDSVEHADADPKAKDHSTNGKADDAADSARHGDKTEADKPTSDKSHKEDDTAHHDGDKHPKDTDDKHTTKTDDADTKPTKDEADTHKSDKDSAEHKDSDPKAKDHSTNGKADDAADSTRHSDKTETDKPTSDKSHKEDDTAHHDGNEHPKDTDDTDTHKSDKDDTDDDSDKNREYEDLHDHSQDGKHDPSYDPDSDPHTKYAEDYDTPPDPSIDQNVGFPEGVDPYTTPPQTRRQLQEALEAWPEYMKQKLPPDAKEWHTGRFGFDDMVNPERALGFNPDGSPRSMKDFMDTFFDKEKGQPVWPFDVAGKRKNGALLNADYHEYDSIQPFIDKHGSDLCRLGDPGGKFAAAVHKDGTLPSFGERGLFQPFSLGAPDMRAHLTGELPEGHIVKYGRVAPAFGQPGGAIQLQIWGPDEKTGIIRELTLREWKKRGIIEYVKHD